MGSPALQLVVIARTAAQAVEGFTDAAGLDPSSRRVTVGRGDAVRGVEVTQNERGGFDLGVDVVGFAGTDLRAVGARLRRRILDESDDGAALGAVEVAFSDLIDPQPEVGA